MSSTAVTELVAAAATQLRAEGQGSAAEEFLSKSRTQPSSTPIVLVAGEDKRGKSSLVNALLQRPDLSPVGVEVTTGAPISLFFSDPERAAVVRYGEQRSVDTDVATARALATVQGNPSNRENIRAVQIGVPCPLLNRVLIVDTPGVGGLTSGHAELTLQSLQFADALLFVTEAGAQLRGAELEFLRRAASRIDTVILVMTKIDAFRGWRTIAADNLKILTEQAPRLAKAPMIPVSSSLALRALSLGPDEAAEVRAEAGFTTLEAALTDQIVSRAAVLRDSNLLRELIWPLASADRAVSEQLDALASDGVSRQKLEDERLRLRKIGEDRGELPRRLDTEIRKLTLQRTEDCARGIGEIRRRYDDRLKDASKHDRDSLPGELVADLTALGGRLNEEAARRLNALIESVIDDIDSASSVRQSIEEATSSQLAEQLNLMQLGSTVLTKYDKLSVLSGFSSGRSLSTLVSGGGLGLTAGAIIAPPVGIAIGLGLGALYAFQSFRARSQTAYMTEFKAWMSEQCNQTQITVNTSFQRELIDLQDEIRLAVRQALNEREAQITASLAATERLLQTEKDQREVAETRLRERRSNLRELQRRAIVELDALRGESPPASA